jgi:hypothetical protein
VGHHREQSSRGRDVDRQRRGLSRERALIDAAAAFAFRSHLLVGPRLERERFRRQLAVEGEVLEAPLAEDPVAVPKHVMDGEAEGSVDGDLVGALERLLRSIVGVVVFRIRSLRHGTGSSAFRFRTRCWQRLTF